MEKELPESEERTYIEKFIKNSSRGIIRGTLE
jgi:hypothetical protein